MDVLLQKCDLTRDQQNIMDDEECNGRYQLSSFSERLREKQISEEIIQSFITNRKELSLE